MARSLIACKTCEAGRLFSRRRYRMSGPVVVIGYLLLIPSILGILVCALLFVGVGGATAQVMDDARSAARHELTAANVPAGIVEKVASSQSLTTTELAALSDSQRRVVNEQQISVGGQVVAAGLGGVFAGTASVCVGISCFIGGLLGWLLVMKKKVLQCNMCSAVVAAS